MQAWRPPICFSDYINCSPESGPESVQQDFKDTTIIQLYKRKGDQLDCNNHRGIALLPTAGKILTRVIGYPGLQRKFTPRANVALEQTVEQLTLILKCDKHRRSVASNTRTCTSFLFIYQKHLTQSATLVCGNYCDASVAQRSWLTSFDRFTTV